MTQKKIMYNCNKILLEYEHREEGQSESQEAATLPVLKMEDGAGSQETQAPPRYWKRQETI